VKISAFAVSLVVSLALLSQSGAQTSSERVRIDVHADRAEGPLPAVWNFFGYDEPNYTYAPNGVKLLGELATLSPVPVYVRTHNLLTTGDGSSSLKWGSTNVYTEDAAGHAVYNWTVLDRIFDAFHDTGTKPLVEIGFMPQALSTHPDPYRHNFPQGSIYTGWAYPPTDYKKWSEVVFHFVQHLRERYGEKETKNWLWEIWNEPDIDYWKGSPEEYFKLYDVSVDAILRALPGARVGGPDSTGPASAKAIEFLRAFLDHCAHGQNFATGKTGSPLEFISFHPKGSPKWLGDHVQMGIAHHLVAIEQGFKIVASFPEWRQTPIILGESDPEGCAACSARTNPQNSYRNGPLYAVYTAEVMNNLLALIHREGVNFLGAVTWAFEFENQPYFEGFRSLATNGVDKPVLNAFRMFGLLGNERIAAMSRAALPSDEIVKAGVRRRPDVNAIAARKDHEVEILAWNYHDDDVPGSAALIELVVSGLPSKAGRCLIEHYRVDSSDSNAFTAWEEMGSPQSPSPAQQGHLEAAGQLQLLSSPTWSTIDQGSVRLEFSLPRQGLSLVRISW